MLAFEERGKPEYPDKNLSVQSREPTNSTHIWRRVWESNPGHIGGRRVLSATVPSLHPQFTLHVLFWALGRFRSSPLNEVVNKLLFYRIIKQTRSYLKGTIAGIVGLFTAFTSNPAIDILNIKGWCIHFFKLSYVGNFPFPCLTLVTFTGVYKP